MAWTAPRTWVASEVTTAALFNTHLRDNMLILGTAIGADGRLVALSASYLASLDGTNLTGVAVVGAANTYTAGKQDLSGGTARVVIPVGTDKFDGAAGNKTPGSLWVEGNYLHHVAESTKVEWRYLGTSVGASAGTVGSVWVDTDAMLHYIDSSGVERYVLSSSYPHADGAAVGGSLWAEGYLHWANTGGQEYEGHADTHSDGTSHSDVAHTNTHSDSHGDVAHDDVAASHTDTHADHTDVGHADYHADTTTLHTDVAHTDTYSDTHGDVSHADHSDHADVAHDDRPESIGT